MAKKIRVRQGKTQSMAGFAIGLVFCAIGLFVAIPVTGAFGVLWTVMAVIITALNGINAFSEKGIASHEIEIDGGAEKKDALAGGQRAGADSEVEKRLEQARSLYESGFMTAEEYEKKRKQIIDEL